MASIVPPTGKRKTSTRIAASINAGTKTQPTIWTSPAFPIRSLYLQQKRPELVCSIGKLLELVITEDL